MSIFQVLGIFKKTSWSNSYLNWRITSRNKMLKQNISDQIFSWNLVMRVFKVFSQKKRCYSEPDILKSQQMNNLSMVFRIFWLQRKHFRIHSKKDCCVQYFNGFMFIAVFLLLFFVHILNWTKMLFQLMRVFISLSELYLNSIADNNKKFSKSHPSSDHIIYRYIIW